MSKSKFEKQATELLNDEENVAKKVSNGYRLAKSTVEVQIAMLNGEIVQMEQKIAEQKEVVHAVKFSLNFNLEELDKAEEKLESLEDDLKALNSTLDGRKNLLEEWK